MCAHSKTENHLDKKFWQSFDQVCSLLEKNCLYWIKVFSSLNIFPAFVYLIKPIRKLVYLLLLFYTLVSSLSYQSLQHLHLIIIIIIVVITI